jgi:putative ABC transport system permease protein
VVARLGLILVALLASWACNQEGSSFYKEPPANSYSSQAFRLQVGDRTISLDGARVTPEFWAETRVQPSFGRLFVPEEYADPSNRVVALLSNDLWEESFHSDRGTIGRIINLDGVPTTIVGILPPGFQFPERALLWVPKRSEPM